MTGRRRGTSEGKPAEREEVSKYGYGCIGRFNRLLAQAGQEIGEYDVRDEEITQLLGKTNVIDLATEYLYAVHILDRFEWALDSAVRERDYLRAMAALDGCRTCRHSDPANGHLTCLLPEPPQPGRDGGCEGYEYAGLQEDWRADDEL